jgi:hypothetical protein
MGILIKNIIEKLILPHQTVGDPDFETTLPLTEVVTAIFYGLKTGC